MPEAFELAVRSSASQVVSGGHIFMVDVPVTGTLPKEVLRVLRVVATAYAAGTGQEIGRLLAHPRPAST